MSFYTLTNELKHSKYLSVLLFFSLSIFFVLGCNFVGFGKFLLIILGVAIGIFLLFTPELSAILFFSSGVFKEYLGNHVPFFLSIDVSILLAGLTIVSIIIRRIRDGDTFNIPLHISYLPLLLFVIWIWLSYLYSPSPEYGLHKTTTFLIFNSLMFFSATFFISDEKVALKMIRYFMLIGLVITIPTVINLVVSLVKQDLLELYRATFEGVNPINYANWIGNLLILLICIYPILKTRFAKIFQLSVIFLLLVSFLAANSRGPFVGFVATIFFIFVIFSFYKKKKIYLLYFFIGLFVLTVLLITILPAQLISRYYLLVGAQQQQVPIDSVSIYTMQSRFLFWESALTLFLSSFKTFFFGSGIGGFSYALFHQDVPWYPHNIVLEVLAELGIIGFCLIFFQFFSVLKESIFLISKSLSNEQKIILFAFLMVFFFNFVTAQFSGDLSYNRRLWFILGTLVALNIHYRSVLNK